MITGCDAEKVHALLDGELPAGPAAAVRLHLGRCASCQSAFEEALLVDVLAESFGVPEPPAPVVALVATPSRPQPAVKRGVTLVTCVALAIAAILAAWRPSQEPPPRAAVGPSFEAVATRPRWHEWRVAYRPADRHRRLASGSAVGVDLAAVERTGDVRALAIAELLAGHPASAEARLRLLAPTPDVLTDRAAVALARGSLESARSLLDAALARAPRHPQALWNKALVLQRQGHASAAARLFREVAALGEPGWSDEARTRAAGAR